MRRLGEEVGWGIGIVLAVVLTVFLLPFVALMWFLDGIRVPYSGE